MFQPAPQSSSAPLSQNITPNNPIQPGQQPSSQPKKDRKLVIILLNAVPAGILYLISLGLTFIILFYSNHGSITQDIISPIAFFGLFVFLPVATLDIITLFVLIKRGHKLQSYIRTIGLILLLWSPLFISFAYNSFSAHTTGKAYNNSHNPDQAQAISLILGCKVSYIQQGNNGLIDLLITDSDPTQGGTSTNANWDTLVNAVNTANQKCPKRVLYYNKTPVLTWLTLDESTSMISQCKISLASSDNVLSNPTTHWNYFKARGLGPEMPSGTETGYLLENQGNYPTLTVDYSLQSKIIPIVNQYKSSCKMDDNLPAN